MTISKDKQYKTAGGREVRIYATDCSGTHPVHGAVKIGGEWIANEWTAKGHSYSDGFGDHSEDDLVEVRERIQLRRWANVLKVGNVLSGDGYGLDIHPTKHSAEEYRYSLPKTDEVVARAVEINIDVEKGFGVYN